MARANLQSLENRLDQLERRVADKIDEARHQQTLVDSLIVVNDKVRALTAGRSKFGDIGRDLAKLDVLLTTPDVLDMKIDENLLLESVLGEEGRLREEAALIEHISNSKKILDSNAIRDYEELEPKLNQIRITTLQQHQDTKRINAATRELIEKYNNVTVIIKQQLAAWDLKLKRLENERRENGGRKKSIVEEFD